MCENTVTHAHIWISWNMASRVSKQSSVFVLLTINVKHHLPHGRPHGLMETEPNLPPTPEGMVVALWSREEGTPHRSVPRGRKAEIMRKEFKDWGMKENEEGKKINQKSDRINGGKEETAPRVDRKCKISWHILNWECRSICVYTVSHSAALRYDLKPHQWNERVVTPTGPIDLVLPPPRGDTLIITRWDTFFLVNPGLTVCGDDAAVRSPAVIANKAKWKVSIKGLFNNALEESFIRSVRWYCVRLCSSRGLGKWYRAEDGMRSMV